MQTVYFDFNSPLPHLNQLVTGLLLLHKQKKIDLKIRYGKFQAQNAFTTAEVNGKLIGYDVSDASLVNQALYDRVDVYYKRMCLKSDLQKFSKLRPLGFNYSCYTPGLDFFWMNWKITPFNSLADLKKMPKYVPLLGAIMPISNSVRNAVYTAFEGKPENRSFHVVFSARLWEPNAAVTEAKREERLRINDERIELVRKLKTAFPGKYTGGIQRWYLSEQLAPDTIIPDKLYYKPNFLKAIKTASIGIATAGLEDSVGFKFGEYIAAAMCILTTPDFEKYAFPGRFERDKNYILFDTISSCMDVLKDLEQHPDKMQSVMQNNYTYYQQYLSPDKLMYHTLFA